MRTIIEVSCEDQVLSVVKDPLVASGGIHENFIAFSFCSKWDGLTKTAVFYRDAKNLSDVYHSIVDSAGMCEIPHEVTENPGILYFGVFGVIGDAIKTSEIVAYKVKQGALTSELVVTDPSPDIWQQLLSSYNDALNMIDELRKGQTDFIGEVNEKLKGVEELSLKVSTLQDDLGDKVDKSEIVDSVDSTDKKAPLSANIGHVLSENIIEIENHLGYSRNLIQYNSNYKPGWTQSNAYVGISNTVNDDYSITVDAPNLGGLATIGIGYIPLEGINEEIIISGCPEGGSEETYSICVNYTPSGDTTGQIFDTGHGVRLNPNDVKSGTNPTVDIVGKAGTELHDAIFYPMVRLSSVENDTYEPGGKNDKIREVNNRLTEEATFIKDHVGLSKNLLYITRAKTYNYKTSYIIVNNDKSITLHGTFTTPAPDMVGQTFQLGQMSGSYPFDGSDDFVLSGLPQELRDLGCNLQVNYIDGSGGEAIAQDPSYGVTFKPYSPEVSCSLYIPAGLELNSVKIYPMIVHLSDKGMDYVPGNGPDRIAELERELAYAKSKIESQIIPLYTKELDISASSGSSWYAYIGRGNGPGFGFFPENFLEEKLSGTYLYEFDLVITGTYDDSSELLNNRNFVIYAKYPCILTDGEKVYVNGHYYFTGLPHASSSSSTGSLVENVISFNELDVPTVTFPSFLNGVKDETGLQIKFAEAKTGGKLKLSVYRGKEPIKLYD